MPYRPPEKVQAAAHKFEFMEDAKVDQVHQSYASSHLKVTTLSSVHCERDGQAGGRVAPASHAEAAAVGGAGKRAVGCQPALPFRLH